MMGDLLLRIRDLLAARIVAPGGYWVLVTHPEEHTEDAAWRRAVSPAADGLDGHLGNEPAVFVEEFHPRPLTRRGLRRALHDRHREAVLRYPKHRVRIRPVERIGGVRP